jgi:hypothetical protein
VRWSVAGVLILIALVSGVLSAWQTHGQDVEIQALSRGQDTGFSNVRSDIDSLKAQTPRVPRIELHSSGGIVIGPLTTGGTLVGLNLTITNDGDDVIFSDHYAIGGSPTTTDFGRRVIFDKIRRTLKAGTIWVHLRRNASQIVGVNFSHPLDNAQLVNLLAGKMTAYFVVRFDVRSTTGLKRTLYYCSFYQGHLPVLCRDNTI